MRVAIKVGYDGSHFSGFAMQPGKKTVEGEIIKRLKKTNIIKGRKEAKFQYAARTDKGVSAFGNVIAFNCRGNAIRVMKGLKNIWVFGYAEVDEKFNPRYCRTKIYRYYLPAKKIDIRKMKEAAGLFVGEHDFSYFARVDARNPVRRMDRIDVIKKGDVIKIDFEAPSFLWNQIRRIVAAMTRYAEGKINIDDIVDALEKKKRANFGLAPAENLILLDIKYDFEFMPLLPEEIVIKREIFMDAPTIHRNK